MVEKKYFVYVHENKKNGKVYVGITSKEKPEMRWKNGSGYKDSYFGNAINKYGWNNFEHKILFKELSQVDACEKEKQLIKDLKAQDREHGYNIAEGGQFPIKASYDALYKLHQARKIPVIRLNDCKIFDSIIEAEKVTGVPNPNITKCCKGTRFSAGKMPDGNPMIWQYYVKGTDYKNILRDNIKQAEQNKRYNKCNQKVVCVNTGEVFLSLSDAENKYDIFLENIIKCCKGKYKHCGVDDSGYPLKWKYYYDYVKMSDKEIEEYKKDKQVGLKKRIECIEHGLKFCSISDAAKYYFGDNYKSGRALIRAQLYGKTKCVYINNKIDQIHFIERS